MRRLRFDGSPKFDPRRHYLVVVTPECLDRTPLSVPIFEIRDGRHARLVDCASVEGRRVVSSGTNVLYVGASNSFDAPIRNVPLRDVLEGLLGSAVSESLRTSLLAHLEELGPRTAPRGRGAAA